ncbi:MAG: flagellar motor switch protein FliN, partial [Paracoccaceae bacterium]|nr:flagellar motor switch protein FliN [Paracoccaceae bacterium]
FVGDKLIARGELQELEDTNISQLAVRLTEIIDPPSGSRK